VHVLIIPKEHIANVKEINESNAQILIDIHKAANKVAEDLGIAEKGYRLITTVEWRQGKRFPPSLSLAGWSGYGS